MLRRIGICCFCLLSFLQLQAMEAVVSHAVFYLQEPGKTGKPYIELYWQIDPASIHYAHMPDSQWQTRIQTDIVFRNDTGIVNEAHFILQSVPKPTFEEAAVQSIIDLHRYVLPPGNIKVHIHFSEIIFPGNDFHYTDSFTIPPPASQPYYSDIQLLDTAYDSPVKNIFQKNDKQQIPLSTNFIDDSRNILHLYTELYKTDVVTKDQLPLRQRVFISKKMLEAPILKLQHIDTIQPTQVLPFIGQFDIAALPSGNFYLNAILENKQGEALAQKAVFFQRSNKNPATVGKEANDTGSMQRVNLFDLGKTFVAKYDFAQIRAILKMMLPISNHSEALTINGFLNKPEETYMRYFIYNFWKARDNIDPKKAWDQYTAKVKETNKLFGAGTTRGYETQRGFIYLKYGKPNERVIVENEQGSLPYEVWQYNSTARQGSAGIFLFYRPENVVVDMILLHSTVIGETRNAAWRSLLYTNGNNPFARAEQYLK